MIGKAKSIKETKAFVNYTLRGDKQSEILIHNNCSGITGKEISQEFKVIQDLNRRCVNKTIALLLSPEEEDGKKLTNQKMVEICKSFMDEMGLSNHQYIAVQHNNTKHKHVHIIANRIDFNGVARKDHYIGKDANYGAQMVAKDFGLISARDKMFDNAEESKIKLTESKLRVKKAHKEVISSAKNYSFSFSDYVDEMKKKGVTILPTINKQGNLQGFRVAGVGKDPKGAKASEIFRDMTVSKMGKDRFRDIDTDFTISSNYIEKYVNKKRYEDKKREEELQKKMQPEPTPVKVEPKKVVEPIQQPKKVELSPIEVEKRRNGMLVEMLNKGDTDSFIKAVRSKRIALPNDFLKLNIIQNKSVKFNDAISTLQAIGVPNDRLKELIQSEKVVSKEKNTPLKSAFNLTDRDKKNDRKR